MKKAKAKAYIVSKPKTVEDLEQIILDLHDGKRPKEHGELEIFGECGQACTVVYSSHRKTVQICCYDCGGLIEEIKVAEHTTH